MMFISFHLKEKVPVSSEQHGGYIGGRQYGLGRVIIQNCDV